MFWRISVVQIIVFWQKGPNAKAGTVEGGHDGNGNNNIKQGNNIGNIEPITPSSSEAPKKFRLNSLDTFRGITIALMIFVNDGAGGYWFFEHATWNGLQLADVVFPWYAHIYHIYRLIVILNLYDMCIHCMYCNSILGSCGLWGFAFPSRLNLHWKRRPHWPFRCTM